MRFQQFDWENDLEKLRASSIAVILCISESWPVLILAPSSLRLQWASMIQQWLDIPSSDILVVLSQSGGSNKGGFTIVSSNTKSSINLDGVFNIISYDLVPKLQSMLMASDFKGLFGQYQGASNHEELHNFIKATMMIQRLKRMFFLNFP
ncbi:hypothetical protein K1719_043200 [Acacia pycnantha]|nr:hypothetical protein K1719_043200 [Acacia pycnantha]